VASSVVVRGGGQAQALAALWKGFAEGLGESLCFNPHHGILARSEGHLCEVLICYECCNAKLFVNGKEIGRWGTSWTSKAVLDATLDAGRE